MFGLYSLRYTGIICVYKLELIRYDRNARFIYIYIYIYIYMCVCVCLNACMRQHVYVIHYYTGYFYHNFICELSTATKNLQKNIIKGLYQPYNNIAAIKASPATLLSVLIACLACRCIIVLVVMNTKGTGITFGYGPWYSSWKMSRQ